MPFDAEHKHKYALDSLPDLFCKYPAGAHPFNSFMHSITTKNYAIQITTFENVYWNDHSHDLNDPDWSTLSIMVCLLGNVYKQ